MDGCITAGTNRNRQENIIFEYSCCKASVRCGQRAFIPNRTRYFQRFVNCGTAFLRQNHITAGFGASACHRCGGIPKKVAIIDERGELAGTYCGIPQNDLGLCSDILDHYPKGEGLIQAVRALSPQFIFCDELGGQEDLEAIQQGLHAGAAIISTIHAGNIDDLLRKKQGQSLLQSQAFGHVAMMDAIILGQIAEIHKAGDLLGQIGRQYCSGVHDNAVRLHGVV